MTSAPSARRTPSEASSAPLPLTLAVLIVAFGALVAAGGRCRSWWGVLAITIALGLVTIEARYTPCPCSCAEHHHHGGARRGY